MFSAGASATRRMLPLAGFSSTKSSAWLLTLCLMHSRTPRVSQWEICEAFCCYWAPEGSILWADEESRTTRIRSALGLTYEVMSFRSNRNTAIPTSSAKAIRL